MTQALTLPSYPLYLLLHPAHVAALRACSVQGEPPPAPTGTNAPPADQGSPPGN